MEYTNNISNSTTNSIKPINNDTVHKICSSQVVLSLAVAVKELVENSLDAGATYVDIKLKNYGIDLLEVSDNGSGVTEDNFAALTLKYHTSKLSDYSDLLGIASFGFRGEALSSLCSLADLIITTRHESSQYATKLRFDRKGIIINQTLCARQVGTTVTLTNLFCSLPVRQKEFHKNAKREFNKMTNLLYAYCLICKGVKITCSNQTSSNNKSLVVATQGSSYKDNIISVFGIKQLQNILEIKTELVTNIKENIFRGLSGVIKENDESITIADIEIDLSEDSNDAQNDEIKCSQEVVSSQKSQGYKNTPNPVLLEGYISSCAHGSGRSSTDRQFFYVNSRPCEPTKVIKLINEIYRQYNTNQYPFVFLNINIERLCVDINVTPDKRKVFLTKEKSVLDVVKSSLLKLFENIPRTLVASNVSSQKEEPELRQPRVFQSFIKQFSNQHNKSLLHDIKDFPTSSELKRKSTSSLDSYVTIKKTHVTDEVPVENEEFNTNKNKYNLNLNESVSDAETNDIINRDEQATEKKNIKDVSYLNNINAIPKINHTNVIGESDTIYCKMNNYTKSPKSKVHKVITDKEDLGKYSRKSVNLKTSLEQIKVLTELYNKTNNKANLNRIKFKAAINPVFNKKCEEELNKEISKESFKRMAIVGQFNLGFIITRLDDDLFIIDQHATDEIYNFETLQKTTELSTQKLVIPQQLELTGVNEQILMDNLGIFKKNGFTFKIDEHAPPTKRVKLLTLPMSKNWIFGKDDIEELLFVLKEGQTEHCRPSRVRAMFASRACRKSVMIGTALGKADMRTLVDHMADIDKPWNCPHGRPTIRHLVNLAMVQTKDDFTLK